jgi:chitinase
VDNRFLGRIVDLKKKNPKLKVLLALGGWNDSEGDKYSRLVNSLPARRKFISHAIDFMSQYDFDGLDLDWEYPTCWQTDCEKGPAHDKRGFALLVSELKAELHPRGMLLTAAVSPSKKVIDAAYDVPVLAHDLDYLNVMAYDYHGAWDKHAEHHAPLFKRPESKSFDENDNIFNVNYTVNYWMHKGMPAHKIIVGVPFYGRSFQMDGHELQKAARAGRSTYGIKILGAGEPGKFSREKGYLAYYEICQMIKGDEWTKRRDQHSGPYAFSNNQWVGYDDATALLEKTEFIKANHLGGAMIWAIDLDDFRGQCCGVKYPLLKTLNFGLRGLHSFSVRSLGCV